MRALAFRLLYWWICLRRDAAEGEVVCDRVRERPSRLLLPQFDLARYALVFVTSRRWWELAWWRLVGPLARALVMLGAWDVRPGDRWTTGRFNWRVWRAGRPWGA